MKQRITKKMGRHRKGIGPGQLRNVRLEQQVREIEAELRRRGIDPSAAAARHAKGQQR